MNSLLADYDSSSSSNSSSEDERDVKAKAAPTPAQTSTKVAVVTATQPLFPKPTLSSTKTDKKPLQTIDTNMSIFSNTAATNKSNGNDGNDDDDDDDDSVEEAKALKAREAAAAKRDISQITSFSDLLPPPKNAAGSLPSTKRRMVVPAKYRKSATSNAATQGQDHDSKRAKIIDDCAFAFSNVTVPSFGEEEEEDDDERTNKGEDKEGGRNAPPPPYAMKNDNGTMWDYSRPAQRSRSNYVYSTSDAGMREKELERVEHSTEDTALDLSSDYLRTLRTEEEEMLQDNPAFVQTIAAPTFHLGANSRRKHQLKYLAVDAYYKEQSLAIKRANGKKSKAQTQSKYGW